MANKGFGTVRRLPSGKWQVRYYGPDGQRRSAPYTFGTKSAATRWLRITEAQIVNGEWVDPDRARITVGEYAQQWITQRPGLRPRTVELYEWLLDKHIQPGLGNVSLGKLSTATVRQWRADRLAAGVSGSVTAKAYRLLRAVLNTAVEEDRILLRNPCRVRGADREQPSERPTLTVAQVFELADRMPARFRLLVLLASFGNLRWGEVSALRRRDIGEKAEWINVARAHVESTSQGLIVGPPKSRAGMRTITVPEAVRQDVRAHLDTFVGEDPDALVFTGDNGGPLRRPNFNQRSRWGKVVADMGLTGLHFHDLRHAGNIWASKAGMSTKDLMARMGHDDMRAALIYQRATDEADRFIADRLSDMAAEHRNNESSDGEDEAASNSKDTDESA